MEILPIFGMPPRIAHDVLPHVAWVYGSNSNFPARHIPQEIFSHYATTIFVPALVLGWTAESILRGANMPDWSTLARDESLPPSCAFAKGKSGSMQPISSFIVLDALIHPSGVTIPNAYSRFRLYPNTLDGDQILWPDNAAGSVPPSPPLFVAAAAVSPATDQNEFPIPGLLVWFPYYLPL